LVIPDQEDALDPLVSKLREIDASDPSAVFHVLVPLGHRSHDPLALAEAREHAATHLERVQRLLAAVGIAADGEVAEDRLMWSIDRVLESDRYDTIVLSTPPSALRSVLGLDVAAHVERTYQIPVVHVVAAGAKWPQPPPEQ
jgi:hypothetical protein